MQKPRVGSSRLGAFLFLHICFGTGPWVGAYKTMRYYEKPTNQSKMTLLSETKTQLFRHNDHYLRRRENDRGEVTWEEMHVDHDQFYEITEEHRVEQLERIA